MIRLKLRSGGASVKTMRLVQEFDTLLAPRGGLRPMGDLQRAGSGVRITAGRPLMHLAKGQPVILPRMHGSGR
jgi:hypothetical protein